MTRSPGRELVASHWGVYEVERVQGRAERLLPLREDPSPSPIGTGMLQAYRQGPRVLRPAVRAGWLDHGPGKRSDRRGCEPFVELSWKEAAGLVATEMLRVREQHGNKAIFGGSYGWASAGRFHHSQSQIRRFMNVLGGCVQRADSYSLGAGRVVLPHVVGGLEENILYCATDWKVLASHTRLMVTFGGIPAKNGQVQAGGPSLHLLPGGLAGLASAGCRFVNFSAVRSDLEVPDTCYEWIPIRPNTDTAAMLALATEIILAKRHDREFLEKYCVGFAEWERYLLGQVDGTVKDAEWAGPITGIDPVRLRMLALDMAAQLDGRRTMINVTWSLQRADHGEQPYWAAVALASVIGQLGLPGGGFSLGYGTVNSVGSYYPSFPGPTLPVGDNPVKEFIPVARISDMLLHPGESFDYNGGRYTYPDIRLVYWAGGNTFHHHQDLNRLLHAWRKPDTVIVHEQVWNAQAKFADIVLPASTSLEREDIGYAQRDPFLVAMQAIEEPPGLAASDYEIFRLVARSMGKEAEFTEGYDAKGWLRVMWESWRERMLALGFVPPAYDDFQEAGYWRVPGESQPSILMENFRRDPSASPLPTPSGRIEISSAKIASFEYADCPGFPTWLEPAEWLGGELASEYPLHLISDQPHNKLHSQLDFSDLCRNGKIQGREPIWMHPDVAASRNIESGQIVRVFNGRGACLAGALVTDQIRPGVVKLSVGAWWDPESPGTVGSLDKHGNANVLTRDVGASRLSQGCAAQTCLVEIEAFAGPVPPVTAFDMPEFRQP